MKTGIEFFITATFGLIVGGIAGGAIRRELTFLLLILYFTRIAIERVGARGAEQSR